MLIPTMLSICSFAPRPDFRKALVTWRESLARSLPRRYNGLMHRWLNLAIALAVMSAPSAEPPLSAPPRQGGTVPAIMARLTPLEKVGQLFLVTFSGPAAPPGSDI